MKMVLFDLGDTLEHNDELLPGAVKTLESIAKMRDPDGAPVVLSLGSDFEMPTQSSDLPHIREKYYAILRKLGIDRFFQPLASRVTLSSEVGVFKPAAAFFEAVVAKTASDMRFADVLFVSENRIHVDTARRLGMHALSVCPPDGTGGDMTSLAELIPHVQAHIHPPTARTAAAAIVRGHPRPAQVTDACERAGASWVRLKDVLVIEGDRTVLETIAPTGSIRDDISPTHLRLVTQNGRLFQQDKPDVPVLVDLGRYLVVTDDTAHQDLEGHLPCYSVAKIPWNTVIVDTRVPEVGRRRTPDLDVQKSVNAVSRREFELDLRTLVSFTTRYSTSPDFVAAADWAGDVLDSLGYRVRTQTITVAGKPSRNVIADRTGTSPAPRDVVIVSAHLDSINIAGGPHAPAPGADDNASGCAGILTLARALAETTVSQDLRFILFGGEEQGLFGSNQYVASLSSLDRARVRAVLNMDMIATTNTTEPTVLLEGAALSQQVIDGLAEAAHTYTALAVETSLTPFNSDHVHFINHGIPAVLTIEGADSSNNNIHSPDDTVDTIDANLATEILRMNAAFIAEATSSP